METLILRFVHIWHIGQAAFLAITFSVHDNLITKPVQVHLWIIHTMRKTAVVLDLRVASITYDPLTH